MEAENSTQDIDTFMKQPNNIPLLLKKSLLSETTKFQLSRQQSDAATTIVDKQDHLAAQKTNRRKSANPLKHTLSEELDEKCSVGFESDQFMDNFHKTELVDNCDVYSSHLPSDELHRPVQTVQTKLDQLHNVRKNFTEPKWRSNGSKPAVIKPKMVMTTPNLLQTKEFTQNGSFPISKPITINRSELQKTPHMFPSNMSSQIRIAPQPQSTPTATLTLLGPIGSGTLINPTISCNTPNLSYTPTAAITSALSPHIHPKSEGSIDSGVTDNPDSTIPNSPGELSLFKLREKAVAIKTCMSLTMEEVEKLILGDKVVKVSNRKKPDQSLKYPCRFCIYFNHDTNGHVKLRSFGRKEEIKRHHMLHLRYERFQCQYCPYKVVRSDHLHRHMKNKHPEVNHPGPQSNRRRRKSDELPMIGYSAAFPGLTYEPCLTVGDKSGSEEEDEFSAEFFRNVKPRNTMSSLFQANALGQNPLHPQTIQLIMQSMQNGHLPLQQILRNNALNSRETLPHFNLPGQQARNIEVQHEDSDDNGELVIACEENDEDEDIEELDASVKSEIPDDSEAKYMKCNDGSRVPSFAS